MGSKLLEQVLQLREAMYRDFHYGPFIISVGADIHEQLEHRYYEVGGLTTALRDMTIRQRLLSVEGVENIQVDKYAMGLRLIQVTN